LVTAPSNSQLPWFKEPQTLEPSKNRPAKAVFSFQTKRLRWPSN